MALRVYHWGAVKNQGKITQCYIILMFMQGETDGTVWVRFSVGIIHDSITEYLRLYGRLISSHYWYSVYLQLDFWLKLSDSGAEAWSSCSEITHHALVCMEFFIFSILNHMLGLLVWLIISCVECEAHLKCIRARENHMMTGGGHLALHWGGCVLQPFPVQIISAEPFKL